MFFLKSNSPGFTPSDVRHAMGLRGVCSTPSVACECKEVVWQASTECSYNASLDAELVSSEALTTMSGDLEKNNNASFHQVRCQILF